MSKARSMYAGSSGSNYGVNKNSPGNGNGKWQGLPPITNMRSHLIPYTNTRARGNNRNVVFCMNQLGGVGKISNMYATTADGIVDCEHNQFIKHGGTYTPPTGGGNLTLGNIAVQDPKTKELLLFKGDGKGDLQKTDVIDLDGSGRFLIGKLPAFVEFPNLSRGGTNSGAYNGLVNYKWLGTPGSSDAFKGKLTTETRVPATDPTKMSETPLYKTGIPLSTKDGSRIDINNDVSVDNFEWYVLPSVGIQWKEARQSELGTSRIARVIRNNYSSDGLPFALGTEALDSPGLIAEYDTSILVFDINKLTNATDDQKSKISELIKSDSNTAIKTQLANLLKQVNNWHKAFGPINRLHNILTDDNPLIVITNSNGKVPNATNINVPTTSVTCDSAEGPFPQQWIKIGCEYPKWPIDVIGSLLPTIPTNSGEPWGGVDWPFWPADEGAFIWKTKPKNNDYVWLVRKTDNLVDSWRFIGTVNTRSLFGINNGVFPVWPDV